MKQSEDKKENTDEKFENLESEENSAVLTPEEVNNIIRENEFLASQAAEYLESLQRERASFVNYKKRIDQDNLQVYDTALIDQVKTFLPVIDDLQRALSHRPAEASAAAWVNGLNLILQKLLKTFENNGVIAYDVQPGAEFDPNSQEAITHEENPDFSNGQVIETVQAGYKLKDRIIRPALVRVAK